MPAVAYGTFIIIIKYKCYCISLCLSHSRAIYMQLFRIGIFVSTSDMHAVLTFQILLVSSYS